MKQNFGKINGFDWNADTHVCFIGIAFWITKTKLNPDLVDHVATTSLKDFIRQHSNSIGNAGQNRVYLSVCRNWVSGSKQL